MKYIITESQLKTLQEVGIGKGTFKSSPVQYFWTFINGFSERRRVNAFRNYYTKVVGADVSDLSDDNILEFYDELDELGTSALPKKLKSRNILSGFAFYLATKFTKLKNGRGLVYFIDETESRNYYFFDPASKLFVGRIGTNRSDITSGESYKVKMTAADKSLIGMGYGTKMYLSILDDVDYLISDGTLYQTSLRVWTSSLPKYSNVWVMNGDSEFIPFKSGDDYNPEDVKYFIASIRNSEIG
jgi:hypothetical protein